MVADWMWMKRTEFTNYDEAVTGYDVLRAEYDAYTTEWNTYLDDNLAIVEWTVSLIIILVLECSLLHKKSSHQFQ